MRFASRQLVELWLAVSGSPRAKRPPVAQLGIAEALFPGAGSMRSRKWVLRVRNAPICRPCGQFPVPASCQGRACALEQRAPGRTPLCADCKPTPPCTAGKVPMDPASCEESDERIAAAHRQHAAVHHSHSHLLPHVLPHPVQQLHRRVARRRGFVRFEKSVPTGERHLQLAC